MQEMIDRVSHLATASGTPTRDWSAWDDETIVNEEPEIPSLSDQEKTEGFVPDFDRNQYRLDEDDPPPSSSGMVLWTPAGNEVIAPPPPSLGFDRKPSLASTAVWQPGNNREPSNQLAKIQDAEIVSDHGSAGPSVSAMPRGIERRTPDGRMETRHPDGRIEIRTPDGRLEVRHVDGRIETTYSDGRIEVRFNDGRLETRYADGAVETRFVDGRLETRYANGSIETRFPDGRIEVRHADGRIETRWEAVGVERASHGSRGIDRNTGRNASIQPLQDEPPPTRIEARVINLPTPIPPNLVLLADPYSERADAFRGLRRKLAAASNPKTIAVMSPSLGEGRTTTALNLAIALRETARAKVLLVEANMRSPGIAKLLQFEPPECFVLQMQSHRDNATLPWTVAEQGNNLHILAVNPASQRPPLLDPIAFNTAMERLKNAGYEYIVLDTPPVVGSVDANLIADASDGVLMAAWSMKTTKGALKKAIAQLAPAPVLGIIMIED
jgi:Mrp family chromosome partitioning ATPase